MKISPIVLFVALVATGCHRPQPLLKRAVGARALPLLPQAAPTVAPQHTVTIAWYDNNIPRAQSYTVYWGFTPHNYVGTQSTTNQEYTINLGTNTAYPYISVSAVNTQGIESDLSQEFTYTNYVVITLIGSTNMATWSPIVTNTFINPSNTMQFYRQSITNWNNWK